MSFAHEASTDDHFWVVATRIALIVVGGILAVLVVTGVMLIFNYRPEMSAAYATVQKLPSHAQTRDVHRIASRLLFPAFGCLAVAATCLALVRHRARRIVPIAVAGLGVLAASFTGFMLPWDQLSLTQVTVGTNVSGYGRILSGKGVKFVILGQTEVGTATVARWFWMHVLVTSGFLVAALAIVAVQTRRVRRKTDPPVPEPEATANVPML